MIPMNQDIVDAAKRAGIPVEDIRGELSIAFTGNAFMIYMDNDTRPGSALFIVAVLGVLPYDVAGALVKRAEGHWGVRYGISRKWAPTLTEACAHAIVAAYPAKEAAPE